MRNPLQFAVVREDPRVEEKIIRAFKARSALLIGSGGCTALALKASLPELALTLLDMNPAQIAHVRKKISNLYHPRDAAWRRRFNVGSPAATGLNACGNFEGLFRELRFFLEEFVAPPAEWAALFGASPANRRAACAEFFKNPYWKTAFELFFSDELLNTMFGPEATQHAASGSYPAYFRKTLERGLLRADAPENYFLHHIFLGHYRAAPACWPLYLAKIPARESLRGLKFVRGRVADLKDLGAFDLIHLSNICDWSSKAVNRSLLRDVSARAKPGAVVVIRQLNNAADLGALFGGRFKFYPRLAREILAADRSLFYSNLLVGVKRR